MGKITILVMMIVIFSKVLGFGREMVLSYFFGASNVSDAYIISLTIPFLIFEFVGMAILTTYLPIVSEIKHNEGENEVERFTNNLMSIISILSTVVVGVVVVFATPIVKIFASGFTEETLVLAVTLSRISVLGIYFTGYVYIFKSYLHYKRSYLAPELIGFPLNSIIICGIIMSYHFGTKYLALSGIIAALAQFIFLIPFVKRNQFTFKFNLSFKDKYIQKMITLSLPVMFGISMNQINLFVDRTIASRIYIGGISALDYSNRLNLFIQSIFVLSIANVLYPIINEMAATKNWDNLKKTLAKVIRSISIFVVPLTMGTLIFAKEIVQLLYGRGAFDEQDTFMTTSALFFYAFGMLGFGLREVLSRTFYCMQDTKTPMMNAAIGMVLNIILNIILSRYLGIGGLALATSIAASVTTVLLLKSLGKKIGPFGVKQLGGSFLKILVASLIMSLFAKLAFNTFAATLSQNLSLLLGISVGASTYFVMIYFMKVEDVDVIVGALKNKLGKGSV